MTTDAPTVEPMPVRRHVIETLRLALPVVMARAGILVLVAVDIAMTGHAGTFELAWYALAQAPQVPLLLVGIGLMLGTLILTAQANGAETLAECGAVWRVSLVHALLIGTVFLLICQAGTPLLAMLGQEPELAAGGGRVLAMLGYGLPGALLYTTTSFFLEGINRPVPGMVVMLFANVLNLFLNWVFIFGNLGMPAMGAEGAALATTIVRWASFLALAAWLLRVIDLKRYGIRGRLAAPLAISARLRRIGYPMALAHGLEAGAFAALTLFAGLLGPAQVGGFQIAMNLVALAFMCALGFATAASVRVGYAVGRNDGDGVIKAGWTACGMAVVVLTAVGSAYFTLPGLLAAVYSADVEVVVVAVSTIQVAALVLVPDAAQAVLIGALRGASDVWPATALAFLSFWVVMIPASYWLGVVQSGGAASLMAGVGIGCVTAATLLAARFLRVSRRREIRRA